MRKNIYSNENSQYKIIAVDDESGVLDSLKVFLSKARLQFCWSNRSNGSNRTCKRRTF